jgi:hypothetical protein
MRRRLASAASALDPDQGSGSGRSKTRMSLKRIIILKKFNFGSQMFSEGIEFTPGPWNSSKKL